MTPRPHVSGDRRARAAAPRGGYVMIEALATLAIGALLLAALASLAGGMLKIGDRTAAGLETIEVDGRIVATVADEIRRAARLRFAGAGEARPFVFSGAPGQIAFALAPEQADGLRAPVVVVWQTAENGDLLRAEGQLVGLETALSEVELAPVRRVARGLATLRFAYVGRAPGGGEIVTDSWSAPTELPAAVRIDRIEPASGRRLSSLSVPLLADAEPGCADPQKGLCSRVARKPDPAAGGEGRSRFGASARASAPSPDPQ